MSTRRTYSAEFRAEAVALVASGQRVERVAVQLGIPHGTLWNWVKLMRSATASRSASSPIRGLVITDGMASTDPVDPAQYQAALRRIAELERENEFLGKASAYFAQKVHP